MEIPAEKVNVTFHEAKNKEGQDFDIDQADTYKAVYFVEPASGNPSYHVSRNITVKEKTDESQSGTDSENEQEDQSQEPAQEVGEADFPDLETAPQESMTEAQMEAVIEDMEEAEDIWEDAEKIAEDGGLLLFSMDTRTTARMARAVSGNVSLVTGREVYYPTNLGNYSTNYFTVNGRLAYCLESPKGTLGTGSYASYVLENNPNLQKTLYYGFGGAGDLTDQFMTRFGEDLKYVFTHIAASYYFSAPMSVSGNWNSGEMRGSIRTIWKALVVTTGDANQDIGSYYEEENGNSVSFSVEWMELAKVKVIKVDSASNARLSGAVFGIYSDEACRNLIIIVQNMSQIKVLFKDSHESLVGNWVRTFIPRRQRKRDAQISF